MRVLVVGGAGYIGSHTALVLSDAGHEPVVYDNLEMGHDWAVQWGPLIQGDLADGDRLRQTFRDYEIDAVIDFAAYTDVGESVENPRKYFRNNVANTLNLLEAMQDSGVSDIIFSSTCAIYGIPQHVPIEESHPLAPISPYGESKLMVERLLRWFGEAYGLNWVALRYFNAAGADPEARIGECHGPETHLIPVVMDAVLGKRGPVKIFGTDYPTSDGTAVRDYTHVLDLADAHIQALTLLKNGGDSQALNLGSGHGYSVREVIASVERVSGQTVPAEEGPRRAGDPPAFVADATRATEILGWQPAYAALDDIVRTAWRWHSRPERPHR